MQLDAGSSSDAARSPVGYIEFAKWFLAVDRLAACLETEFGGWLAWPLVKEQLWHRGFRHMTGTGLDGAPTAAVTPGRLAAGLWELLLNIVAPRRASLAVLYSPRGVGDGTGGQIHPHLGRLLDERSDILECVYEWGGSGGPARPRRGRICSALSGAFISAAARPWRLHPAVRKQSARLTDAIAPHLQGVPAHLIYQSCRGDLARFVIKTAIFRWLFRRAGVERILVTDPDGKCAEIAAAKSLGLPVFEIQHGMFGRWEPEYAWTSGYRTRKHKMAVPDRVLVFGPLWRDELLRNGFWQADEVINVGNAVLCARHKTAPPRPASKDPIKVLFPTQYYVREDAIIFWDKVLTLQNELDEPILRLVINVHPAESQMADTYNRLAERHPQYCVMTSKDQDGFEAMVESNAVVGYTSFMLMEALGLDKHAISLCSGAACGGMAGSFGLEVLESVMPHISTPEMLLEHFRDRAAISRHARGGEKKADPTEIFFVPEQGFDRHLIEVLGKA